MRANTWVAIAGVTVSLALGKLVMTGKHPRSEDTAVEDKRDSKQARSMQQGASTTPGPTAKEIKAAEEARARLAGAEALPSSSAAQQVLPDGPEPVVFEVEYTPTEQLEPLEDAEAQSKEALALAGSKDWTAACRGLLLIRRLARHNKDLCEPQLDVVVPLALKSLRSLRSSLCKTAVMCATDLFSTFGSGMSDFMDAGGPKKPGDSLLAQLLLKASSNDKQFVIEEVQRCLQTMAEAVEPVLCIEHLLPYGAHKNPKVRGRVAVALEASTQRCTPEQLLQCDISSLLKAAASMVTDNTQEARAAAKQLLSQLRQAHDAMPAPVSVVQPGKENTEDNVPGVKTRRSAKGSSKLAAKDTNSMGAGEASGSAAQSGRGAKQGWEDFCKNAAGGTAGLLDPGQERVMAVAAPLQPKGLATPVKAPAAPADFSPGRLRAVKAPAAPASTPAQAPVSAAGQAPAPAAAETQPAASVQAAPRPSEAASEGAAAPRVRRSRQPGDPEHVRRSRQPGEPEHERKTKSMYSKLGGKAAVDAAVLEFYKRIASDPKINHFFEGVDMRKLARKQVHFMTYAFGGPEEYKGRDLGAAHSRVIRELGADDRHFDIVVAHFQGALMHLKVDQVHINDAVKHLAPLRLLFEKEPEPAATPKTPSSVVSGVPATEGKPAEGRLSARRSFW